MSTRHKPLPKERLLAWLVILLAAVAIAFGGLWWRERAVAAAYRDAAVCWDVVREGGPAFGDVRVRVTSHPTAAVTGWVGSAADRERLRQRLADELGGRRWPSVAFQVRVGAEPIVRTDPPSTGPGPRGR
jgi:hypothetical protein